MGDIHAVLQKLAGPEAPVLSAFLKESREITTKTRNALPEGQFAIPGKRKYPIHDRHHAANAKARVAQFGSAEEKAQVNAAVARKYPDMGK